MILQRGKMKHLNKKKSPLELLTLVHSFDLTVTCPSGTVVTAYESIAMFESGAIEGRANSTNATCPYYTERG